MRSTTQGDLCYAECGHCGLSEPDEFGNRDLLEDATCPVHGPVRMCERCEKAPAAIEIVGYAGDELCLECQLQVSLCSRCHRYACPRTIEEEAAA